MSGLKPNPNAKPAPADQKSYSDGVLDLANFIGEILPTTDQVLSGIGGDLKNYQSLLKDDQVYALLQQRMAALTAAEWEVDAGGEDKADLDCADFIRNQLKAINFEAVRGKMHLGVLFGYSVAEGMFSKDGPLILLDAIKVRAPWRFGFGKDGLLKLKVGPQIQTMPERKFWVATWNAADDDSPYGLGLGHQLWWPVYLKRNGARFWAAFLDKFAVPGTVATYPAEGTDDDINKRKKMALEAAMAMRSESAIAMPAGFEVKLIESTSKGTGDFQGFLSYWDDAIAKIILSQTGTSRIGQYTGTAEVHQSVSAQIVKQDADLLCESLNSSIVRWLAEWNFPNAKLPKVWMRVEDKTAATAQAEMDAKTFAMGLRLTDDEIKRRYGEAWERGETSAPTLPADFAESSDPDWLPTMDPIRAAIQRLLDDCADEVEFQERLAQLVTNLPVAALADNLDGN